MQGWGREWVWCLCLCWNQGAHAVKAVRARKTIRVYLV